MSGEILIRGGLIAAVTGLIEADILVRNEKIYTVGPGLDPLPGTTIIEAEVKNMFSPAVWTFTPISIWLTEASALATIGKQAQ